MHGAAGFGERLRERWWALVMEGGGRPCGPPAA